MKMNKNEVLITLVLSLLYMLGIGVLIYLKLLGMNELGLIKSGQRLEIVPVVMLTAFVISVVLGILEFLVFRDWGHLSLPTFIALKYGIVAVVITIFELLIFTGYINHIDPTRNFIAESWQFFRSETFISVFLYMLVFSTTLNILATVSSYLGPEGVINVLAGRYKEPKEEDLVFLFLDLRSSTSMAEELGHKKYSQMIGTCFGLLTNLIYKHRASLYQFVGDEAVLFWKVGKAQKTAAPAALFFEFCEILKDHSGHFQNAYGHLPEFRAAVHQGTVTVTVIKSVKRDVVYHEMCSIHARGYFNSVDNLMQTSWFLPK